MSVALEYLYQDIIEHEVKLIAGKYGLRNKIRWIHTVETEDTATFLQGQEIVFTTGVAVKNSNQLLSLIKTTKEQNASAIVVSIGNYITQINKEVINYCEENNYPLFVVPLDQRIADVMKMLTIKIIESERNYLEIANALKDAIFLPNHEELYIPILEKIGFKTSWRYIVTTIELESKNSSILNKLYIDLSKNFKNLNFYAGTGKHTSSLEKLYKGYEEAKDVAKINRLLRNSNVHIRYSELGIYRLLLAIENKDIIKEFHDETIGDLEVYDEINGTDYVELLINYFENNCKVNETANSLYIHRNTVNYKINKIQEILDLNLSDMGDRSKIYLSLMIRYLI